MRCSSLYVEELKTHWLMSTGPPATQSQSRRWSHVFPDGEDEFQLAEAGRVPGPNWRSLSTPAVLPVETDVLPEDFGRPTPSRRRTIPLCLRCRRTKRPPRPSRRWWHSGSRAIINWSKMPKKGHHLSRRDASQPTLEGRVAQQMDRSLHNARDSFPPSQRRRSRTQKPSIYTLSMGHRIQVLAYNRVERRVDVRAYRSRFGSNAIPPTGLITSTDCGAARRALLKPKTNVPQISRAGDELEHARSGARRAIAAFRHSGVREVETELLAVVPPRLQDDLEGDDYATRFSKFEAFLNGKRRRVRRH